jgi:hypothetical protein
MGWVRVNLHCLISMHQHDSNLTEEHEFPPLPEIDTLEASIKECLVLDFYELT